MRRTWLEIAAAALLAALAVWLLPDALELFALINATVFVSLAVLALSLGLVWGFGGILCFGQTTFFGLGAYAYAVAAINFGDTTWAVPLALTVPTLAAAALGYLMFFGRISDVYMGVITLTVTLILFAFTNSTAGDQWTIGIAALGGFNGIPGTPPLNLPLQPDAPLTPQQVFVVAVVCLTACYAIAKLLLLSRFGRVAVAIRENELRAELFGTTCACTSWGCSHWAAPWLGWPAFSSPTACSLAQPCSRCPTPGRSSSGFSSVASALWWVR